MACRILVPWPGIEPRPWPWKCQGLTTGPLGNSLENPFKPVVYQLAFKLRQLKIHQKHEIETNQNHESSHRRVLYSLLTGTAKFYPPRDRFYSYGQMLNLSLLSHLIDDCVLLHINSYELAVEFFWGVGGGSFYAYWIICPFNAHLLLHVVLLVECHVKAIFKSTKDFVLFPHHFLKRFYLHNFISGYF